MPNLLTVEENVDRKKKAAVARAVAWNKAHPERRREIALKWYREHREQANASSARWERANPERCRKTSAAWRARNPEVWKAANKKFYAANRDEQRARKKKWCQENAATVYAMRKRWKSANPDKVKDSLRRKKARRRSCVHSGLDFRAERELFMSAQALTRATGILHHVDHIIPTKVGGWHHHLNLQVLPAPVNEHKNADPFWQMTGYKSWRDVPEYLWPEKLVPAYRAIIEKENPIPQN